MKEAVAILSFVALSGAISWGCKDDVVPPEPGPVTQSITVRGTLSPGYETTWQPEARIGLYSSEILNAEKTGAFNIPLTISEGSGTARGTFVTDFKPGEGTNRFYAYYPYSETMGSDPEAVQGVLPKIQTQKITGISQADAYSFLYASATAEASDGPMAVDMRFENLFAVIEFRIAFDEMYIGRRLSRITLASDAEVSLAGSYVVDLTAGSVEPVFAERCSEIALDFADDVSAIQSSGSVSAWMVMAPADMAGNTFGVTLTVDGEPFDFEVAGAAYEAGKVYPIELAVADPAIDLNANGAYANSYIVSQPGVYTFKTSRPDGTSVENIHNADWLWSTFDDAGNGLISDVSYNDGSIRFTASEGRGNALLAAFDGDGNIMWSWHMWLTDTPQDITYDNGNVFMDRNVGAVSAAPEDGAATFGLKYQWGRKDPFYAGSTNEDSATAFDRARENTVVNPAYTDSWGWESVQGDEQNGTVDYAVGHPMSFIYANANKDWLAVQDNTLWGAEAVKSVYDPCPAGYRIPHEDSWRGLMAENMHVDDDNYGRIYVSESGAVTSWYPFNGVRWGDRVSDRGYLGYVGDFGSGGCWSSAVPGINGGQFYYLRGLISPQHGNPRADGFAVRCLKE